jgi:hypothetical protein
VFIGRQKFDKVEMWRAGISSGESITSTSNNPLTTITIGRAADGGLNNVGACRTYLMAYWDRALSREEILSLTANPWQIVESIQQRPYFDASPSVPAEPPATIAAPYIIVPSRRRSQSQDIIKIKQSNPYANRLAFAFGGNSSVDIVSQLKGTLLTGYTKTPLGVGVLGSSTVEPLRYDLPTAPLVTSNDIGTGDFSIMWVGDPPDGTSLKIPFFIGQPSTYYVSFWVTNSVSGKVQFATYDDTLLALVDATGISLARGIFHTLIGIRRNGQQRLFVDGIEYGTPASSTRSVLFGGLGKSVGIGAYLNLSYVNYASLATSVAAYAWNRSLLDREIVELSRNPWLPISSDSSIITYDGITQSTSGIVPVSHTIANPDLITDYTDLRVRGKAHR